MVYIACDMVYIACDMVYIACDMFYIACDMFYQALVLQATNTGIRRPGYEADMYY